MRLSAGHLISITGSSTIQLFASEKINLEDQQFIEDTLTDLSGLICQRCMPALMTPQPRPSVETQMEQIRGTNFYGTPTIFIGDEVFVGPKPYRVYAIALKGFFYWLRK